MPYSIPADVQQLISAQLASGRYSNADEVLRDALQALQELDDEAAIQAAIDDWKNGDEGMSIDDAFATIRAEFGREPSE